jgi:mono/diheme cytochrome c family protein
MNRRRIRVVGLAAVVLALVLVLVACGSTPEPTVEPAESGVSPEAPEATAVPATPTEGAPTTGREGGALFPSSRPSAARGQAVFAASCASCHGEAGDGSGLAGAADFTDAELVRGSTPAGFYRAIRDGVEGSAMPAWAGTLDEMEIWDVLYYERSLAIAPQTLVQGQEQFSQLCISCHGAAGDGSGLAGAADFTDLAFMAGRAPNEFFQAIDEGVAGSAMPAWGDQLDADQIWALVSYVGTFAYEVLEEPGATEPSPTETPETAATATPAAPAEPDPQVGAELWQEKPCSGCHGPQAMGGIGPRLADTTLAFDEVLLRVRVGKDPMPAFSEQEVSDQELRHIYAWLQSLVVPTDTPEPTETPEPDAPTATPKAALPPSGHLMAFWEDVNWVKVHSDFAKDASADIGALHDRVRQAQDRANDALQQADLAIADIPDAQAQATIQEVKGYLRQVLDHANAALGTQDFNAARAEAAEMVAISRLDAWPLASLAVKQAGFVGSVLVRVKQPNGSPFAGALVTGLTAPNPSAGQTDSNGQVLIRGLAAVRVMQIKAYSDGLVYHEVHVTVPEGGRAVADITLPGPSTAGQTPAISNVSLAPSSGPGNGQVTFRMTGTDPQGKANIAEDQVFALNPDLGQAYVLRSAGGDVWEKTVQLPNLSAGTHTWYFFIVDHQCNTSNVVTRSYTAQ